MKRFLLSGIIMLCVVVNHAQWTPITIPNTSTAITNLNSLVDTVYAGFNGDGIFKTTDLGATWSDISGNLSEKNINKITPGGGAILFVGTTNGAFLTFDQQSYDNNTSTGLSNTDVTHYWLGGELDNNDFTVGTNGGGFYYGPEFSGPWTAANNGLSGDALKITSFGGYSDGPDTYYMLGTMGGVYFSNDEFASWMGGNTGLTGDQLHVTGCALLGTLSIITTQGGAFYSMDYGQTWVTIFSDIKFNQLHMYPGGAGINIWLFGEESYYSNDLQNWTSFATPGEVICGATTSEDVFIATTNSKDEATIYQQPISWIITSINENVNSNNGIKLTSYPNPFNNTATLSINLTQKQFVEVEVYDLYGKKLVNAYKGALEAGNNEITIEASNFKSGVYTIVVRADKGTSAIKVIKK